MNETEANEIINYINSKYQEKLPSVVRTLIRGKSKKIRKKIKNHFIFFWIPNFTVRKNTGGIPKSLQCKI